MSSRLIDSLATTDALAEVFSDQSILQAMLDFEAALARAEAKAGVIPGRAAESISAAARAEVSTRRRLLERHAAREPSRFRWSMR